jgi:Glycosyl transferase family 2
MNLQSSQTELTSRGLENQDGASPAMSVVLVTPDRFGSLRKTIQHLQVQTAYDRLEIIIVAPSQKELDLDPSELDGFFRYEVVEVNVSESVSAAKAAAIYRATAPLVVFGEDHNFPEPSWAEALIEAHRQPWVGVGPVLCNANPGAFSWSNFFISYGPWIEPARSGVTSALSEHNTSYKRAILLELGSQLESLMERDGGLHRALQNRGHQLYVESRARTHHLNFDRLIPSVVLRFHAGRAFGATRARAGKWSFMRRVLYAGGTPLIPLIRFRNVAHEMTRTGRKGELLPGILPALVLLLIATAVGESTGYLFGLGQTYRRLDAYEFSGLSLDRPPGFARVTQS